MEKNSWAKKEKVAFPEESFKEEPGFPVIMTGLASIKDLILDPIALIFTLSGFWSFGVGAAIGFFLSFIGSFLYGAGMFFWVLSRGGGIRKRLFQWIAVRVPLALFASIIPGIQMIVPENMLLIIFVHRFEKKLFRKVKKP